MTKPATVIGEALTDVLVRADGTSRGLPGGSAANVALGLGRLGHEVCFATRIGSDPFGVRLRERLRSGGVTLAAGSVVGSRTSTATARLDASGSATYSFDIRWELAEETVQAVRAAPPAHLHTGSIASALRPGSHTVLDLLQGARAAATVSYDPNLRPALLGPPQQERECVEHLVAAGDVVKASDEDLAWLYPGVDPARSAARWIEQGGPALVVLTMGARGARAWWRHGSTEIRAPQVEVRDTVGAGDAFTSALLGGLLSAGLLGAGGRPRAALTAATSGTELAEPVRHALVLAAHAAALTCTRDGADPPTAAELARAAR